jgi:hypothetical protein
MILSMNRPSTLVRAVLRNLETIAETNRPKANANLYKLNGCMQLERFA